MNEVELVEWIRKHAASPACRELVLGIGDDCAIFRPRKGEDLVFKVDPLIEGVHFTEALPPNAVGARALARSLSDIAAMGADPRFCLVSLAVGPGHDETWIKAFFRGLLQLARKTDTTLAGGDLAHSLRETHACVTVCGSVPSGKALQRDGACVGDALYVSGRLGGAAAGQWRTAIRPRLDLGRQLRGLATSCMDLSDGLSLDLRRLCLASDVGVHLERIPVSRGATLEEALHAGEDYELLFTLPPGKVAPRGTSRIGAIVKDSAGEVYYRGEPLIPRGYDHFS